MNEGVRGGHGDEHRDERPQWLGIALTVLPPLSLIVALLVYFARLRELAYARALGFNPSLLEETSIPVYLIGSVESVFLPLLVAVIGLLLWLWMDRMLRRWARDRVHLQAISRFSWALPVSGVILILVIPVMQTFFPLTQPYVSLASPFLLTLAVLAAAYGASLRLAVRNNTGRKDGTSHRWAINALTGLLVALLLFWGMDGFAQVVGRGLAERVIEQPQLYTRPVLLYSAQDLHFDPVAASRQELPDDEYSAYRYRYEGLRLVFVNGDHYFLVGQTWQSRSGTLIVLPADGIRIEFPREVT